MDVPPTFQIPLVLLISLIGFLLVLKLSDFSVSSSAPVHDSSSKALHSDISIAISETDGDETSTYGSSPTSVIQTPPRKKEKKSLIPPGSEGLVNTPAGRRSARIAAKASYKDE